MRAFSDLSMLLDSTGRKRELFGIDPQGHRFVGKCLTTVREQLYDSESLSPLFRRISVASTALMFLNFSLSSGLCNVQPKPLFATMVDETYNFLKTNLLPHRMNGHTAF